MSELSEAGTAIESTRTARAAVDTWRVVAGEFGRLVDEVPAKRWRWASPCDGWAVVDVVRHLLEWVPPFLAAGADIEVRGWPLRAPQPGPAWKAFADDIEVVLADPTVGERTFSHDKAGDFPLDVAIERFVIGDVLLHTWDLGRGADLPFTLDSSLTAAMLEGMRPMADMLVASGHYDEAVPVSDRASIEDQLVALTGRDPSWTH